MAFWQQMEKNMTQVLSKAHKDMARAQKDQFKEQMDSFMRLAAKNFAADGLTDETTAYKVMARAYNDSKAGTNMGVRMKINADGLAAKMAKRKCKDGKCPLERPKGKSKVRGKLDDARKEAAKHAPKKCQQILVRGKNKGKKCGRACAKGAHYCHTHNVEDESSDGYDSESSDGYDSESTDGYDSESEDDDSESEDDE
tara:strand:- start:284 stop:877 length:594 start_codon:yes stop_codon:yes gene_type:complete